MSTETFIPQFIELTNKASKIHKRAMRVLLTEFEANRISEDTFKCIATVWMRSIQATLAQRQKVPKMPAVCKYHTEQNRKTAQMLFASMKAIIGREEDTARLNIFCLKILEIIKQGLLTPQVQQEALQLCKKRMDSKMLVAGLARFGLTYNEAPQRRAA